MQKTGTVVRWDATRAFGFIRSPDTPADVFFHVRDFHGSHPPRAGLSVVFEEIHMGGKGPRAMAVRPVGEAAGAAFSSSTFSPSTPQSARRSAATPAAARPQAHASGQRQRSRRATAARSAPAHSLGASHAPALLLMAAWAGLIAWGLWTRQLPWWVLGAVVALNFLALIVYALDKQAAQAGTWRTSEKNLHLLALVGGWPGAWWAQQILRHKSSKAEFRAVYWLTVLLNCGGLVAWLWGGLPIQRFLG